MAYGDDAAGERTSLTYPSGHQVGYGYDLGGELTSLTDWLSRVTSYGYDAAGRLTAMNLPNGVSRTESYDAAGRLTAIADTKNGSQILAITYATNADGSRTSQVDATGTTSFSYDALQRLTGANYSNGDAATYSYDAAGNRTSQTLNSVQTTNTYNSANELTASNSSGGSTTYAYDANGNETSRAAGSTSTTYGYDGLNRLVSLTGPVTASYAYNGDGLRVAKTVGGLTTNYSWDPSGLGAVLSDGPGSEYVWGQGLIGQVTATGTTYVEGDALGSTRQLTDQSGNVLGTQQYDASGQTRSQTGVQLPFQFTGEQTDAESGLQYLRGRSYDPATGRFLSQDPLAAAGGNGYPYAANNPVNATDPSGLWTATCDAACQGLPPGCTPPAPGTAAAYEGVQCVNEGSGAGGDSGGDSSNCDAEGNCSTVGDPNPPPPPPPPPDPCGGGYSPATGCMPAGSNGGSGGCPGGYDYQDGTCIPPGYHGPPDPGTPPNGTYVSQGEGSIYVPAGADPCTISSTACAGAGLGGAPVGASGPPPPPPEVAEDVVPAAPLVATEDQFGGAILDEVSIGRPIVECGGEQQDTGNACVGPAPSNPGNWSTQELPPPDGPGAGLPATPRTLVVGGTGEGGAGAVTLNNDPTEAPDVVGTASALPFAANSFSAVTYEFLPFAAFTGANIGAISEAARVLQPGGVLVIDTGSLAPVNEITGALSSAEFTDIQTDTSQGYVHITAVLPGGPP